MTWGYHAVYERSFEHAIDRAGELSFDYVQFDLNVPRYYVHTLSADTVKALGKRCRDHGVGVTFHAPGDWVGLTMDIAPIRSAYLDHWKRIIDVAEALGSHHLTFHPLSPPSFTRADSRRDDFELEFLPHYRDAFVQNVTQLARHCATVLIAIENQRFGPAVRAGLELLLPETERVGLTLDVPKLYSTDGAEDSLSLALFERHRDKIVEIHAHDAAPGGMQHMEIGTGSLDFPRYARFFRNTPAWITVEVRPAEAAARSKANLIRLLNL